MNNITYTYEVVRVDQSARSMEIVYRSEGRPTMHIGARLPYEGETLEQIVEMYSPIAFWREQERPTVPVDVGLAGERVDAPPPEMTPEDFLTVERQGMVLSFAQFVVGLVEQGWITSVEGDEWLAANALPAAVEAAINTIPAQLEDGTMPRLRARARALRPSEIHRSNELLLLMASMRGATAENLDDFFRRYAAI